MNKFYTSENGQLAPDSGLKEKNSPISFRMRNFPDSIRTAIDAPLINEEESKIEVHTNRQIDPLANLYRYYQKMCHDSTDLNPIEAIKYFLDNREYVGIKLSLKSIEALSINNDSFCCSIIPLLIDFLQDSPVESYFSEFMQALISVSHCASSEIAEILLKNNSLDLAKRVKDRTYREQVLSLLAVLSKHGNVFEKEYLEEIKKHINYPGKAPLVTSIVWPCLVCVENFLSQKESKAYCFFKEIENTSSLIARLCHSVILYDENQDSDLVLMVLRVLLNVINDLDHNLSPAYQFQTQFLASLDSLKKSKDPSIVKISDKIRSLYNSKNT